MAHNLPLITTLATALGLALIMGFIAIRLRLPTLVGYLFAGIIIGPFTPGIVANPHIAAEFAEIGVMLLMFGVGLHFSVDELLETRKIALPGALLQILVASCLGATVSYFWGWNFSHSIVFGLALSVASTVVLIKALEAQSLLGTINGQIAVGWLIVEDIAMVLALVFLPFIALWSGTSELASSDKNLWLTLGVTILKISSFVAIMLLIGRWGLPRLLWQITKTGSRELFTLCIIAVAVSIAFLAARLFDISFALGAFFAGMILRESRFSRRAAEESLPFRDAFAVLFFVSVGMLFNPAIFIEQPLRVLIVVLIIMLGKSIAAAILVLSFRYPLNTALTVSVSLAQIGEFSFILAGQGVQLKLLPAEGQALILAGALISIALNPLLFKSIEYLQRWLTSSPFLMRFFQRATDPLTELPLTTHEKYLSEHLVLIGYGRVGKRIGEILTARHIPYVVVEQNRELIEDIRSQNIPAVYGNASDPSTLIQAHVARAAMLVVATSDLFNIRQMADIATKLNSKIELAIRVENEDDKNMLAKEIDAEYYLSEEELAKSMGKHILSLFEKPQ
ncbi:monovalent cation:proton antiporter (CPA2 family) [Legionella quinlivanii]|uniref:Monovalent cation:proton antiporter (CPA2 family) n=1 Tax=Legionella quinlivanii TaxID=45073 RepID=A0A0W0Y3G8_9GAMM|nr:cation:proton antiporter [Legionella quinlivanii]KTD51528.1 monovalent cation:proton antiporter (CPA2 family) [Legionella quinlivanii]SEF57953.1 Kef-type potassium/proton antiporter, CPA2 family (TC 2.A.37.1) [Legionella quinlivanii DSM 21216]STY10945.1 monovalent cation:proton antiporter (CPA2 family) [Legionella quinlivanii]